MVGTTNFPTGLDSHSGGDPFGFAEVGNLLTTLLTVDLSAAGTTATVVSTTGFASRGTLVIGSTAADSEVVTYTGKTSTTFTGLTRGVGGTVARAHAATSSYAASAPVAANINDHAAAIAALEIQARTYGREKFLGQLLAILGDTRLLWLPKGTDTTTSTDESLNARTLTHDATIAARLSALGLAYAVSFNGTTQYATTPDAADLSFGNGGTDSAFSVIALANVTNTAGIRMFVSKDNTSNREYSFYLDTVDKLNFFTRDESAAAGSTRLSDSAVTMGAPTLYGASYAGASGGGLTTNQNGTILYQNGLPIASTAFNNGSYGGMDNGAAAFEIGSFTAHTQGYMQGSMALVALCQKQLSASEMWAIKKLVNSYFNLGL